MHPCLESAGFWPVPVIPGLVACSMNFRKTINNSFTKKNEKKKKHNALFTWFHFHSQKSLSLDSNAQTPKSFSVVFCYESLTVSGYKLFWLHVANNAVLATDVRLRSIRVTTATTAFSFFLGTFSEVLFHFNPMSLPLLTSVFTEEGFFECFR